MSEETPPTYTTSIFNQANFNTSAGGLDTAYLNSHYLRYPTAQTGLETIANLATTNNATINGLTVGKGAGSVSNNTAFGVSALSSTTAFATANTAIGYEALTAITNGISNTAVGSNALSSNTGGNYNTALGDSALDSVVGGSLNTGIGYRALYTNTASNNTALGNQALLNTTTGGLNTAVGSNALESNTTGIENTAVGSSCLESAITAGQNTAVGHEALYATTSGSQTAVGFHAARNATGTNNLAIGYRALRGTAATNTGDYNVAIGEDSLFSITTGAQNTAIGYYALKSLTTGSYNVAVGYQAGFAGTANTTGTNNTYIGYQAQADANSYSNSTALGSGATITASNQVVLGSSTETVIIPRRIRYLDAPTIYRTAGGAQTLATNTTVLITFPTLNSSYSGSYTGLTYSAGTFTNSNSYSIVVNVSACISYPFNATGNRYVWIQHSILNRVSQTAVPTASANDCSVSTSADMLLLTGDSFAVYGFQTGSATLTLTHNSTRPNAITISVLA